MAADPGKNTNTLKMNIVFAAVTGLIIGGFAGLWVFIRFIETPLQLENEDLKTEMSRIELGRSNHEQSISEYEKQIEALRNQLEETAVSNATTVQELQQELEAAAASDTATAEELQLKLEKKNAQYQRALKSLKRERQRNQQAGDGRPGKYN